MHLASHAVTSSPHKHKHTDTNLHVCTFLYTTPDPTATKRYDDLFAAAYFFFLFFVVCLLLLLLFFFSSYSDQTNLHGHNLEWPTWTRQGICSYKLMQLFKQNYRIICQVKCAHTAANQFSNLFMSNSFEVVLYLKYAIFLSG